MFDFTTTDSQLSNLCAFIDHWLGPAPADSTAIDQDHLSQLSVPEPLRNFYACTANRLDENGDWMWRNAVPTMLRPSDIRSVESKDQATTSDWLIIGHYLGMCEVRVPATEADCPVVEIDGEESIYHDSLSSYLVRFALRHLATSHQRWKPIAGYEEVVHDIIKTIEPTCDVAWRLPDSRDPSLSHTPPFNPHQQTESEKIWLIENDDVMVYKHGDSDRLTLTARTDDVLDRLLSRDGVAEPSLIELKLGHHDDLDRRQQWVLRVAGDGSAQMTLQIPGIPSAKVLPGTLDISELTRQIDNETNHGTQQPLQGAPQATIVRGRNDSGTRFQPTTQVVAAILAAFIEQVQSPSSEFELAWQTYQPEYLS